MRYPLRQSGIIRSRRGGRSDAPVVLYLLACLVALAAVDAAAQPAPKPNIIFILADDLGYGDLGGYGQKIIQTPHLDRMAAEGMRFTQFYAGSTVCAPSRSVLMTGQHMGHTRVRGNAGAGNYAAQTLAAGDVTVARVLQAGRLRDGAHRQVGARRDRAPRASRTARASTSSTASSTRPTRTTTTRTSSGAMARRCRCPTW